MSAKILFTFLCLSLALIEIKAFVRQPEQRKNGCAQPSLEQELEKGNQEVERHHRHRHHHHKNHHRMEDNLPPHMMGHIRHHPSIPTHHMMAQLWPLFKAMLNKKYSKSGDLSASDDSKLDTKSKATAHVKSKFQTKISETNIEASPNKTHTYIKTTDQKGESDAVVNFNSNMDVIKDKTLKAKSEEESQPMKGQNIFVESDLPKMAMHKHERKSHHLNRSKRQAEEGETTTPSPAGGNGAGGKGAGGKGGKGKDFMKKVGEKIKEVGQVIAKAAKDIGNALGIGGKGKGKGGKATPTPESVQE